jgi:hypothetical protein
MGRHKKIKVEEYSELNKEYLESQEKIYESEMIEQEVEDLEEVFVEEVNGELVEEIEEDFDLMFKENQNKHKIDGKHALKRDTIFHGKLNTENDTDPLFSSSTDFDYSLENYKIDSGTLFEQESLNNDEYLHLKELESDVNLILKSKTNIDFSQNRRKPNKTIFNDYYELLLKELQIKAKYSKCEIFTTLSVYFTDNLYNMFKLLDKKHANNLIKELEFKGYLKDLGDINFI